MPDKRLLAVASLVRCGSVVADIGTDHAYLPVYLVQNGICPHAVAADLRQGPLDSARAHIAAAGLSAVIDARLGDGLAPIAPAEVDDIVIAGMGGDTVAAILAACDWVRDGRYNLVLQPMTHPERVRAWLLQNGFSITAEAPVWEGRRFYHVMAASYTAAAPVCDEAAWYIGGMTAEQAAPYWRRLAQNCRRRAALVAQDGERERLTALAKRLDAAADDL